MAERRGATSRTRLGRKDSVQQSGQRSRSRTIVQSCSGIDRLRRKFSDNRNGLIDLDKDCSLAAQTTLATCRAGISCAIALSTGSRKELDSQAVGLPALRLVISRLQANTAHFSTKTFGQLHRRTGSCSAPASNSPCPITPTSNQNRTGSSELECSQAGNRCRRRSWRR